MTIQIRVHYIGSPNDELDRKICRAMESAGAAWIRSGHDAPNDYREHVFEWRPGDPGLVLI